MADPLPADLVALIENYEASLETIRDRVAAYATTTWQSQDDHGDEAIGRWIAALTPIANGAQALTGTLTANYLAAYAALLDFQATADTIPPDTMTTVALRGVTDTELYGRTNGTFWNKLRDGDPYAVGVAAGAVYVDTVIRTNIQLARATAAQRVLTGHLGTVIIGYRRIVAGRPCSLCSRLSGIFQKSERMALHDRCKCSLAPVYDGFDPGDLSYGPEGSDRGTPRIVQHGELGPIVVAQGDHFST